MEQQQEESQEDELQRQLFENLTFLGDELKYKLMRNNISLDQEILFKGELLPGKSINSEQLSQLFQNDPFYLQKEASVLLSYYLVCKQFPLDFQSETESCETGEAFQKLSQLIGDYEFLNPNEEQQAFEELSKVFTDPSIYSLLEKELGDEGQLTKYAILQLLEYLNIPISQIILDFLLCQLLISTEKNYLIDLQLKDLKILFSNKNSPKKTEQVKIVNEEEIESLKKSPEEGGTKQQLFRQQTKGDSDIELIWGDNYQEVDERDELEEQ